MPSAPSRLRMRAETFDCTVPSFCDARENPSDSYTAMKNRRSSTSIAPPPICFLRRTAKPDCSANQVRCDDIDVLNTLDGFNPQPRISIPFSGPIDPASVNSDSVFLVSLGSTTGGGSFGDKVGINQAVWDPDHNVLYVE